MEDIRKYILGIAKRAKAVTYDVAARNTREKNAALETIADKLEGAADWIVEENKKDMEYAVAAGKSQAMLDRLLLNGARVKTMAQAVRDIVALPDPVGTGSFITRRPNGLQLQRVRVPLGVVAMIFESRPNVTTDASALTLKSGNTVILRGGKESVHSNTALASLIRDGLKQSGFPEDAVQLIERTEHEVVDEMLQLKDYIDVVIPRGGENLVRTVTEKSRIPVIFHDKGVCHVFVDRSADRMKAERIVINAKCQKPSVCNAIEKVLIHRDYPWKKELVQALLDRKVDVIADEKVRAYFPSLKAATEEDWSAEYLDYRITAGEVDSVSAAIDHINRYSSHHSDAIISEDYGSVQDFLRCVDSATVYANASTRFTDGGEFGMGAEVGISNQKLHVRGPMGLEGLTSEKWVIYGDGQIRE
jgi:glutamate-5-semialdehyde dehydrogenase